MLQQIVKINTSFREKVSNNIFIRAHSVKHIVIQTGRALVTYAKLSSAWRNVLGEFIRWNKVSLHVSLNVSLIRGQIIIEIVLILFGAMSLKLDMSAKLIQRSRLQVGLHRNRLPQKVLKKLRHIRRIQTSFAI